MTQSGSADVRISPTAFWSAAAAVALLVVLLHFPAFVRPVVDPDEATAAALAQGMVEGKDLYVEVVDRKPPGMQYLYVASFEITGSDSLVPVRVLMFMAEAAAAVILALSLTDRRERRLLVVALFMFGTATLPLVDSHSASSEGFMVLPVTIAWWCSRRNRPVLAGVALAAAVLLKQPAIFVALPVAFNLWRAPNGPRRAATSLVTTVAVWLGVGALFGLGDFLFWNVSGNSAYLFSESLLRIVGTGAAAVALFLVGHLVLVWLAGKGWRDRGDDVDLWLWLAAAVLGVLAGQRFWGHYFLQLLPPLTALAATQLHRHRVEKVAAVLVATTLVPWAVLTLLPQPNLPPFDDTVAAVEARTGPGDPILVWGTFPEAYWSSGRPMASRFPHTNFVTGVNQSEPTAGAPDDLCADLERSRPRLIVDMSGTGLRAADEAPLEESEVMTPVMRSYSRVDDAGIEEPDGVVLYELTGPWVGCDDQRG